MLRYNQKPNERHRSRADQNHPAWSAWPEGVLSRLRFYQSHFSRERDWSSLDRTAEQQRSEECRRAIHLLLGERVAKLFQRTRHPHFGGIFGNTIGRANL